MQINKWLYIILVVLVLGACKTDVPEIGPYPSKVEGINGNWVLTGVTQVDEKVQQESQKTRNVSMVFTQAQVPTTLSFDTVNLTYTYNAGSNPVLLHTGGEWAFINSKYPEYSWQFPDKISFTDASNTPVEYDLLAPVRPQDKYLTFSVKLGCAVDPEGVFYHLQFERNN